MTFYDVAFADKGSVVPLVVIRIYADGMVEYYDNSKKEVRRLAKMERLSEFDVKMPKWAKTVMRRLERQAEGDLHLLKGYSERGADMGRPSIMPDGYAGARLFMQHVPINSGGYDPGGAYWGLGGKLYCAFGNTPVGRVEVLLESGLVKEAVDNLRKRYPNIAFKTRDTKK